LPPKAGVEYKHGTKIIVQYLPAKDETNIYQQEFKVQPELISNGQKVKGKHTFEIHNMATYSGRKPSTIPTNLSFTLTHSTSSRNEWRYLQKAKFIVVADGERVEMPVYSQTELKKDAPSDKEFYEALIIQSTYDMYSKIANAKNVELQIGTGSFRLSDENIAAFRDFASYLNP
jgi:hypothetical protein